MTDERKQELKQLLQETMKGLQILKKRLGSLSAVLRTYV